MNQTRGVINGRGIKGIDPSPNFFTAKMLMKVLVIAIYVC